MRRRSVALLACLLAATGCSPADAETEEAPRSASTATATPTPTPTAAEPSAMGMCEVMGEDQGAMFLGYPDYVLALSNGDVDMTEHANYLGWAERMSDAAPADARTPLAKFVDPIYQVQSAIDDGTGALSFSTADYKAGTTEILEYCVDAGYRIDQ